MIVFVAQTASIKRRLGKPLNNGNASSKNSYEHEEEEYSNDVGYAANAAEDASAAHRKSRGKKV